MTVKEILVEWLKEHGYDGLCTHGCGCVVDDLIPCVDGIETCEPGYRVPCSSCADCQLDGCEVCDDNGFVIVEKKP
jgi:hypothetical protein